MLVEEGQADLESECKGGRTALHMAAQHGHDDAVKALLKHSHPDLVNHQVKNLSHDRNRA